MGDRAPGDRNAPGERSRRLVEVADLAAQHLAEQELADEQRLIAVEPFRSRAWDAFRTKAESVTQFIAVSDYYAGVMRERLGVDDEKIARVWNGIALEKFPMRDREPDGPPVIGYLARMCEDKGVSLLVEAFLEFAERENHADVRLRIAGARTKADEALVEDLQGKITAAGLSDRVDWLPNISFEEKLDFLHGLTLLSVPANYGECFGLFVVEAMACGIPVVQPRHGGFTEIVEHAESGLLHEPADTQSLVACWEQMLGDSQARSRFGENGRSAVEASFSAERMAQGYVGTVGDLV